MGKEDGSGKPKVGRRPASSRKVSEKPADHEDDEVKSDESHTNHKNLANSFILG
jgi:hypothetical protein